MSTSLSRGSSIGTGDGGGRSSVVSKEPSITMEVKKAKSRRSAMRANSKRTSLVATVGKELKTNLPIARAQPVTNYLEDVTKQSETDRETEQRRRVGGGSSKVSLVTMLKFSTFHERVLMIIGLFFAMISGLGLPTWLVLLAQTLNKFNNLAGIINAIGGDGLEDALNEQLTNLVLAFLIVGCVQLASGFVFVTTWTYTGEQQAVRIKQRFVESALRQDAAWFDEHDREELPTMIANSMVHITGAVGRQIADVFSNACTAAGCLIVALILNVYLALFMLAVVPVVVAAVATISCFVRKRSRFAAEHFSKAGAIATEVISGMKTVASLCAQRWAYANYERNVREGQKHAIYAGGLAGLASGLTGFLFYCTYTVAFIIGTEQVAADKNFATFMKCLFSSDPNCSVTGASIMCCIYGVMLCATFFGLMTPGLNAINLGRQAAKDVFDTIDRVPVINPDSDSGTTLDHLHGKLELRDVLFSYPSRPQVPIFYGFNLIIQPGQSMALVGPSGSGKSTIARLLLRLYDPVQGAVLVDGQAVSSLNLRWWRSQVGYVAQQPTLFPGTLRYNIACGKPGCTDEEVTAAAKAACAHDFIMDFPEQYETYYTGASIQLSGGQMQRISIARAIIRNPSVLLLDEATSALDSNSERQVQDALSNIRKMKQVTTVTVAHRLSTIIDSDQIAVISDGGIAELGTHRQLFLRNGIYTTLCESQGITADSSVTGDGGDGGDGDTSGKQGAAAAAADVEKGISRGQQSETQNGKSHKGDNGNVHDEKQQEEEELLEEEEEEEEELAPLSRLWKYNMPEWFYLIMGVIGAAGVGALAPCESILTAQIVANYYMVDADELRQANLKWELLFLALAVASLAGHLMMGCSFSVCGYRLTRRMRVAAFRAIVRRNIGWFDFPDHSTGELTTRLEADAETCAKVTGWQLGYRIRIFASLGSGVVIALIFTWQVGVTAICCVPLIMVAAVVQGLCLSRRYVKDHRGLSPATILEQGLRGITAVQAYDLQGKVGNDYATALAPEAEGNVKLGFVSGAVFGFSQFAIFVSFALVFYVGAQMLLQGILFSDFFTSILAVMFGAIGVGQVNADFKAQQDGQAAAARIFAVIDEPLDGTDPFSETGQQPASFRGSIDFENCTFSYPSRPNKQIYYKSTENDNDGFCISIKPNESVAFVGKSGCGKSTALQLALRFYEASSGTVRIDGVNIEDLNVQWLRSQIGYVGQQPVLFSGTVKSNILLGKPDATHEEIVSAAKAAAAHDFIMKLDQGYDTDIGTGGSLLSGGQAQRVAIARAIVGNPKMLVLDEATSALDNESERLVQAALNRLQKNQPRTTLTVAHRLVTVKECNKIAVLGNGGVMELGAHEELAKQNGLYHELWMKQGAAEEKLDNMDSMKKDESTVSAVGWSGRLSTTETVNC